MIAPYVDAALDSLARLLALCLPLGLPLAIVAAAACVAYAVAHSSRREETEAAAAAARPLLAGALAWAGVGALAIALFGALSKALPIALEDLNWRDSAEATANPVPDAPPVSQFMPALAELKEQTYTRTLTLPPDFLQRIGAEGVGVLSPYLTDPTAENVLGLVDTFRRSGQDVVFTREVKRLAEEPLPFEGARVRVALKRLPGRAYDARFDGTYVLANPGTEPVQARFVFPLPEAGTVRDLSVKVGGATIAEPNDDRAYEWTGTLTPGESVEAVVAYAVLGARTWSYDIGSARRRVKRLDLQVEAGGPVAYDRGSLQPTSISGTRHAWEMDNVVTAQRLSLTLPAETAARVGLLQAVNALPAALLAFVAGALTLGLWRGPRPRPGTFAAGVVLFALGLGAALVAANYIGATAALVAVPALGALAATRALGVRSLAVGLPAALLPVAFLSPTHSGAIVLLVVVAGILAAWLLRPARAE